MNNVGNSIMIGQINQGKRLLIVEDDTLNQSLLEAIARQVGYENIIVVGTGTEAIKEFEAGCNLVILDIGLPDISGIEVCKYIRMSEFANNLKRIPIIVQTANGKEILTQALKAGASEALQKGSDFSYLIERLKFWLMN